MKKYKNFSGFLGIFASFFLFAAPLFAQDAVVEEPKSPSFMDTFSGLNLEEVLLLILVFFLVLILLYFVSVIQLLIDTLKGTIEENARLKGVPVVKQPSAFSKLMKKLTNANEMEEEADIMLDHDYDGIRELDNSLPPWWKWMFYISIVWSVFYLVNYHVVPIWNSGDLQAARYEQELEEGERLMAEYRLKSADFVDENTVTMPTDKAVIDKGKLKYDEVCAACHGNLGQGEVGPNLADPYWIHGGDIKSVFKTIKYGVPEKGMISWQDQLKASEMQAVAGYILTMQGTNPPNPKAPEGELYVPEDGTASADSAATAP